MGELYLSWRYSSVDDSRSLLSLVLVCCYRKCFAYFSFLFFFLLTFMGFCSLRIEHLLFRYSKGKMIKSIYSNCLATGALSAMW
uniref:Uncharacterized protein n=1 Tax=Rhizophora mucronata TaxID=61149 RepID=A0A2P2JAQ0_RHIMU